MLDQLISWDHSLLLLLNGSDSLFLDGFWWTITKTVTWIPLMACLLYILIKNNDLRKALLLIALTILLVVLCDQFASTICKPWFHRLRPSHNPALYGLVDIVNNHRGGKYGFFSSHAANTFGTATFFSLLFKRWRSTLVLFLWAALSSFSRIYLGLHYPGDIATGIVWGVICGVSLHYLYIYLSQRMNTQRSYYSSAYSSTGYLISDLNLLGLVFTLSLACVLISAVVYASVL